MTDKKNGLTKLLPHCRIVNRALLAHHMLHFGQAQSTPFTVAPLKELIGYMATRPLAKQLKEGTAKVKKLNLDEHTTDILEELTWQEHFHQRTLQTWIGCNSVMVSKYGMSRQQHLP
eukprot:12229764-Ditylum_brightwellii.AAC.1